MASDCTTGPRAETPAEIGFDAPDRGDRRGVDAETRLRRRQRLAHICHHRAAVSDPLLINEPGEIVPDRSLEFRLRLCKAKMSGFGWSPCVTLSKVAASTPLESAAP